MNVRITAASWNAAVQGAGTLRPVPGRSVLVNRTSAGHTVSFDPLAGWRHPWNTVVRWRGGQWQLNIRPGFVNGEPPIVVGSAPPRQEGEENDPTDLDLTQVPWISVPATRLEMMGVPQFFQKKGVAQIREAPNVTVANFDSFNLGSLVDQERGEKLLRVVEVFISTARAQLVSEISQVDATGASGTILEYGARYDTSALERNGNQARIFLGLEFPQTKPPNLFQRLLGLEQDTPEDRLHIATVYFLSPDLASQELNDRWQPYVKHRVFWNLAYTSLNPIPPQPPRRAPFFTGLAGGIGDAIINQTQALQGVLEQNVFNFYRRDDPTGAYWSV
jgi:hypothetical protein